MKGFTGVNVLIPGGSAGVPLRRRAPGTVAFLFGVAQRDELPGQVLVRLLTDLGIGATTARGQLARMRTQGQLEVTHRSGRSVSYGLAGSFATRFRRLRAYASPAGRAWSGRFHAILYQIPEPDRAYRDRLRRMAQLAGYGLLQQGVLIATVDLSDQLATVLREAPPGCTIRTAELVVPVVDAVEMARTAWDLDRTAVSFRAHLAPLSASLEDREPLPAEAATLRRLADLLLQPQLDRLSDPPLPAELLPADWPGPRLLELMTQVRQRHLPAAHDYVETVLKELS